MTEFTHIVGILLVWVGMVVGLGALLLFVAYWWGKFTFEEFPELGAGEEPTTVRRLPEIDIPLDDPYEDLEH